MYNLLPIQCNPSPISPTVHPLSLTYTSLTPCHFLQWTCPIQAPNIPHSKSHFHFLVLRSCQSILPGLRLSVIIYNKFKALWWGAVSHPPNPQAGGPPPVSCPQLLIQFICSHPLYLEDSKMHLHVLIQDWFAAKLLHLNFMFNLLIDSLPGWMKSKAEVVILHTLIKMPGIRKRTFKCQHTNSYYLFSNMTSYVFHYPFPVVPHMHSTKKFKNILFSNIQMHSLNNHLRKYNICRKNSMPTFTLWWDLIPCLRNVINIFFPVRCILVSLLNTCLA
jgi:hypothetical protein